MAFKLRKLLWLTSDNLFRRSLSDNNLAAFTQKIALNRTKDGSRLRVNTPADSSDDEGSKSSFRVSQISSELPVSSLQYSEVTNLGEKKKTSQVVSFSDEERDSFQESIAPLPSSGRVNTSELVKTALKARSDSDYQTDFSILSSTDASKVILTNVQSKQSSANYTSGAVFSFLAYTLYMKG